jgi:hypothetical protein
MKDLFNNLVKIGNQNPGLRGDIAPILDHLKRSSSSPQNRDVDDIYRDVNKMMKERVRDFESLVDVAAELSVRPRYGMGRPNSFPDVPTGGDPDKTIGKAVEVILETPEGNFSGVVWPSASGRGYDSRLFKGTSEPFSKSASWEYDQVGLKTFADKMIDMLW